MAILAFDRFETTLEAACSDTDTSITIPEAAAANLFTAAGLKFDGAVWGDATQRLIRVPMYLDDGTNVERILLPLPAVEGGPTLVERGAMRYAFAAGTPLRCSPSAEHAMQGHVGVQELAGVSQVLVVPGEMVAVGSVASSTFTLQLPDDGSGRQLHMGECWPAEVLLTVTTADPIAVSFKKYDLLADASVLLQGTPGLSTGAVIPAGAVFALFRFRRLPLGLPPYGIRGYYGWLATLETWS